MSVAAQSDLEENKRLIRHVAEVLATGESGAMLELLDDDATWWTPLVGTMTKSEFGTAWAGSGSLLKAPMQFELVALTAEGNRVAVEMESQAELTNDRLYANKYHMLFVLRNGKILEVKEYLDTQHVIDVFGESAKAVD
jgi:uncharacterized protein